MVKMRIGSLILGLWVPATLAIGQITDTIPTYFTDSCSNITIGCANQRVAQNPDLNLYGQWSAGEALSRMPFMMASGQMGFYSNAQMGGLEPQYQAVKLNGLRPAGGQDDRDFRLDRLPTKLLQAASIHYNPSVLLAADAPIGLVTLDLLSPPQKQQFMSDVSFKNTNSPTLLTPQMAISYGDTRGKWSFIAGYSINRIDRLNVVEYQDSLFSGKSENRIKNLVNGLTGTVIYQFTPESSLKLQSVYSQIDDDQSANSAVHPNGDGTLNNNPDTTRMQNQLFLHAHTLTFTNHRRKALFKAELTFSQHTAFENDWHYSQNSTALFQGYTDEYQKNTQAAGNTQWLLKIKNNHFEMDIINGLYFDYLHRDYNRYAYSKERSHRYWDNITDESYLLNEYHPQFYTGINIHGSNWCIIPALRAEYDYGNYQASNISVNTYSFNLNPSINGNVQLNRYFGLNGSVSRQITRAPYNLLVPVDKVYNNTKTVVRGNPDLDPSVSWNFLAGFTLSQLKVGDIGVRGFCTLLSNVFELKPAGTHPDFGYQVYQTVNVDSGMVWGGVVDYSKTISTGSQFESKIWGSVTYLGSSVFDPYLQGTRSINQQPEWLINANLQMGLTQTRVYLTMGLIYSGQSYVGARLYNDVLAPRITHNAYWQANARLQYHLTPKLQLYLIGNNLFNNTEQWQQTNLTARGFVGISVECGGKFSF